MNGGVGRYASIHCALLRYSRLLIEWALESTEATDRAVSFALDAAGVPALPDGEPLLCESPGLFVTLRIDGELRGCIGTIRTDTPLSHSLPRLTLDAAFRDTRFEPLDRVELSRCRIEHSFLSSPHTVGSVDAIELGRHGIIFTLGARHAVFLPEVPVEQGWSLPTTLAALCHKARTALDAWRDPAAQFAVFQTEHYTECRRE